MTKIVQIFCNGFLYDTFRVEASNGRIARSRALLAAYAQGFKPNGGLVSYDVDGVPSKPNS